MLTATLKLSLFSDEETWWWALLTDPQILAAIIGFIGVVIGTYPCCKLRACYFIDSAQTIIIAQVKIHFERNLLHNNGWQ